MFAKALRARRWHVTEGEPDFYGLPEVRCRSWLAVYCFQRGRHEGRLVWRCWRREGFFSSWLVPVGRREGVTPAEHAYELLRKLEPTAEVYFDDE